MALFRVLAVVLMGAIMLPISTTTPKAKTPPQATKPASTPDEIFATQLDKANAALFGYLSIGCDDAKNPAAIANLIAQMNALKEAYEKIPDTGDASLRLKQAELFVGFIEVSRSYVKLKSTTCSAEPDPKSSPNSAPQKQQESPSTFPATDNT